MQMQNHAMRQRCVHRGLERHARISLGGIHALPETRIHLGQIQWNEDVLPHRVGHPFPRCFNPKDAIQLCRAIAGAGLREQRITTYATSKLQ